jgi:hypothetical protein
MTLTFADLAVGSAVFVDANTFVYAFVADPASARPASSCSTGRAG